MASVSPPIDARGRRLIASIAATRDAQISAMVLAYLGGGGKQLADAGLLVRHGSALAAVDDDDLDDRLISMMPHPIAERLGHLGNAAWQDEEESADRWIYRLDMPAVARRALGEIDCSLTKDPVSYLDGVVLDFGAARLPKRKTRVAMWVARGLTMPRSFERFCEFIARRPSEGLRVVVSLDPPERLRHPFLRGHEIVALEDVVDHEDGLAVSPEILAARLRTGLPHTGPVWVSGDGGVLIVHGRWHKFSGGKQKIAVAMLVQAWFKHDPVLPVADILEEGRVRRVNQTAEKPLPRSPHLA